ncbi:MAG: hypothetical protein D6725_09960 [Planctomycetota bacterium]|nr:MAG: hypothetical protein D6725_09960 [Planctomycetota bacterium]
MSCFSAAAIRKPIALRQAPRRRRSGSRGIGPQWSGSAGLRWGCGTGPGRRSRRGGWLAAVALAGLAAGCYAPHIEIPHAPPKPVDVERRAFLQHDPFTDSWLGPDTETRPREYDRPRTPTRRDLEVRELYAKPPGRERSAPPQSGSGRFLPQRLVHP